MSTLLITHPACLEHQKPVGHPERPDRLRAIEQALDDERFPVAGARASAARAARDNRAGPSDGICRSDPRCDACGRPGAASTPTPRCRRAASRRRCARAGGGMLAVDEVMTRRRPTPSSPCARPAITPRRRGRWASACSTTQRSPRATRRSARRRARGDRRFRRAPRQRLAGYFLGGQERDVLLDA